MFTITVMKIKVSNETFNEKNTGFLKYYFIKLTFSKSD
jgi:hypothetical protein